MDTPVVTRIAPSPTGSMHIGTARTALFNWLYARHCGGSFLLRIEDTDTQRSTEAAVGVIFEGLKWLGLEPDAPPVFQSQRADRHRDVALQLLDRGLAYRCYMTAEELEATRAAARQAGGGLRSPWRDCNAPVSRERPFAVRFKAPSEGETIVQDLIKGPIRFGNRQLDDLVILRSDGAPTYNLAVVVDDHDMTITHVIRGDDHVSNAARQSQIYVALGWTVPAFAHLPLIHGADGAKLSKRHGAQATAEFADMGYLPEAMLNYLARLGWGHGDHEIFSVDQAVAWFDIRNVGSSSARLDWGKLNHLNQHYIRLAEDDRLTRATLERLRERGVDLGPAAVAAVGRAVPLVKEGAKTLVQLADLVTFAIARPPVPPEARAKHVTAETAARLSRLAERLRVVDAWTAPELDAAIRDFAEAHAIGIAAFGPALRAVLGRGAPTPDLASALVALGREESLSRIEDAVGAGAP